jgi:hypothetical protein
MKLPDPNAMEDYDPDEELVKVLSRDEVAKLETEAVCPLYGNLLAVPLAHWHAAPKNYQSSPRTA